MKSRGNRYESSVTSITRRALQMAGKWESTKQRDDMRDWMKPQQKETESLAKKVTVMASEKRENRGSIMSWLVTWE